MSATRSPRCARQTERFVEVSVLPVPPFGPRMQMSREFSFCGAISTLVLRAMSLWISKRICSGVAGSMTMSGIKRDRGVQDYGTLVSGHAGVLDRIDSLCFAAPVFFHLTRYFFVP